MCSGPIFLPSLLELEIVEIFDIAGGDADRADAEAGFQIVDAVEIDQPFQRLLQRRGIVIALRLRAAGGHSGAGGIRGVKKPGTPKVAINAALVSLNNERARSPGVTGFQDTGEDTISQNSLRRSTRFQSRCRQ